jgi:hypothetical protein
MSQPAQPERRRSEHGGTTQDAAKEVAQGKTPTKGHPHGTDKGGKGGGRGGGVPPEQQPDHPT